MPKPEQTETPSRDEYQTLKTVMDSLDAHIYVADFHTYEVLFMNKKMKADFGDDLTGKRCYRVFRGMDHPCESCTNSTLVDEEGQPTGVQVWDGFNPLLERWYTNYDRALIWPDQRLVRMQIALDITALKSAQDALRESESRYRVIADHVQDIVWQLNKDLCFTYLSPAVETVLGYPPKEAQGCRVHRFLPESEISKMHRNIQALQDSPPQPSSSPNEYQMLHKDGHLVDAEVISTAVRDQDGNIQGFVGVTRDISERKQAEQELNQLHQELKDHAAKLEQRVEERTQELQTLVDSMAGREIRMAELKDVIQQLREQIIRAGMEPEANDPLLE
jgi:PAS domain S-box-containing protein